MIESLQTSDLKRVVAACFDELEAAHELRAATEKNLTVERQRFETATINAAKVLRALVE